MCPFFRSSEAEAPEQSKQQEVQVAQPRPGVHRRRATVLRVLCTFWRRISQAGCQLGLGRPALIHRWVFTVLFMNISIRIPAFDFEVQFCCRRSIIVWTSCPWTPCVSALQVQCSSLTTLWPCACWAARLPTPWPALLPPCSPNSSQEEEPTLRLVPGRGSRRCSRSSTKPSQTATTETGHEPWRFRPPSSPLPRSLGTQRTVSLSGRPS